MVSTGRRGGSTLGCLLWVLGMAVVLYYGTQIGQHYFEFYQLQEEMRSQARLAPGLPDPVIRRRIADRIDQLGLNIDPRKVKITRGGRPRRIIIETEYADTVVLPAFKRVFVFRPRADEPL
jgi:hypothetical protein